MKRTPSRMQMFSGIKALANRRAVGVFGALLGMVLLAGSVALDSPVADAAQRGDVDTVRSLLRSGSDVNASQGDGMTALHWAADRGDAELAEVLLYAGASVDAGTRIGHYTPLHIAAREGREALARLLIDAGAGVAVETTNSGATPLHLAAAAGSPGIVDALVEAGVDPNIREGAWGQTPLIFAAANNRVVAIERLLAAGADPSLTSTPVDVVERADADRAAEKRIEHFLDEFRAQEGGGPSWQPTPGQVQAAIEASREIQRNWPNVPDPEELAKRGQVEDIELATPADSLQANSAEGVQPVERTDEESQGDDDFQGEEDSQGEEESQGDESASEDAAESGEESSEESDDATNDEEEPARPLSYAQLVGQWGGLTPLLHAVRQGHAGAALALLEGGADINQPSAGDETTPLLMAAINGQFDLALLLLERGADANGSSMAGTTPLFAVLERTWAPRASYAHPQEHQSQNATHLEVLEALLEEGADPNVRLKTHLWYMEYTFGVLRGSGIDLKGATPFWRAAYALDVDAMRLLKDHGADTSIPTVKPAERRRPPDDPMDEEVPADSAAVAGSGSVDGDSTLAQTEAVDDLAAEVEDEDPAEEDQSEDDEEVDHSGVPPVPVGGPAIYPLHAASGVGYGQSFAGNAHRYVPNNWLAAVKFLVEECSADVNQRDHNAYSALHHAASRGDTEMVRYLVDQGAEVTVVSRKGETTADMANGPVQRVRPFPETLDYLVGLGAKNNENCVSC